MKFEVRPADENLYGVSRVYASFDQIDPEPLAPNDNYDVFFDCVESRWIDNQRQAIFGIQSAIDCPTSIIKFRTTRNDDPFQKEPGTRWFEMELGHQEGSYGIEHYASIDHAPIKRTIRNFRPVANETSAQLDRLTDLRPLPESNATDLLRILSINEPARGVAIYDVGQGNCNAICDRFGAPLVYFDLGGGAVSNAKTYPSEIRFCFSHSPAVVLSHWDWDHWASGARHEEALSMKWIAPKQQIGVNHAKFAAKLLQKGNLAMWPEALQRLVTLAGDIVRCSGKNRNDGGLAMLARCAVSGGYLFEALLPGDSRYSAIPDVENMSLSGLVATHHGGRLRDSVLPAPKSLCGTALAYSCGEDNTFRHPLEETRDAHKWKGWESVAFTADLDEKPRGHIGIPRNFAPQLGCNGSNCTLKLTKHASQTRNRAAVEDSAKEIEEYFRLIDFDK